MRFKRAGFLTKIVVLALLIYMATSLLDLRGQIQTIQEERDALAKAVLPKAPAMREVYNDSTGLRLGMFHLTDGTVEICTATGQKETFAL